MKIFKNWYFPDTEEHFIDHLKKFNISEYQKAQRDASFKFLKNKRTAIDIGANVGLWAKDICKVFNSSKLFEPYDLNIECLKKNLESYKNFEIFDCALSNRSGLSQLYIYDNGLGSNTLNPKGDANTKSLTIKTNKLDDFNFTQIDYIKIDVQFHELEVIEGSILTLKNNDPVLCIESARRNEEELSYVKKFSFLLESLNYKIVGGLGKELFFRK